MKRLFPLKHRYVMLVLMLFLMIVYRVKGKGKTITVVTSEEGRTNESQREIVHDCNFNTIPYVLGELPAAQLLRYTNYSLVRFGDVDLELMQGISWPHQTASPELSQALLNILRQDVPGLFIGIYDYFNRPLRTGSGHSHFLNSNPKYKEFLLKNIRLEREYMPTVLSTPFVIGMGTSCVMYDAVYENLREIWRDKDIVLLRGANKQVYTHDVFDTARTQVIIYAPPTQAWQSYKILKEKLFKQNPRSLYILSAGPVAKVLTFDLVTAGRRVLDLGHLAKDYSLYTGNRTVPDNFYSD